MIAYDTRFDPPAPIVQVTIANMLNRRLRLTLPALLDTAADITAIPEAIIQQLKLYPVSKIRLEGVEAHANVVLTYQIRLIVAETSIPRLQVAPVHFDFVVLARDVLNQFRINLDGPALTFTIKS